MKHTPITVNGLIVASRGGKNEIRNSNALIKSAFAKTAFEYIAKEIPDMDMPAYKKRVLSEYKAIV